MVGAFFFALRPDGWARSPLLEGTNEPYRR
jgi:hypothetical protein